MQGRFRIDMLAGVDRVRRPSCVYGVLNFFLRIVAAANKFETINNFDWMQHFPDMVPELGDISQESGDEIRATKIGDMSELAATRTSGVAWRRDRSGATTRTPLTW